MSDGVISLGTLLKIGDGATPEVFTRAPRSRTSMAPC